MCVPWPLPRIPGGLQATRTQLSALRGGCAWVLPLLFAPLAAWTCLKRLIPITKTDLGCCPRQVNTLVWQRAVVFVAEMKLGLLGTSVAPAAHSQHGWVGVNGCEDSGSGWRRALCASGDTGLQEPPLLLSSCPRAPEVEMKWAGASL